MVEHSFTDHAEYEWRPACDYKPIPTRKPPKRCRRQTLENKWILVAPPAGTEPGWVSAPACSPRQVLLSGLQTGRQPAIHTSKAACLYQQTRCQSRAYNLSRGLGLLLHRC